ncbi:MAG TPA: glycosyltransferase family 4 protein [Gemmatimonadales bacterium]|nr:glycosyltransferase family 4 protein [Gemmatimonadales bacterium]
MRVLHVTHNYPRFPADPAGGFVSRLGRAAVATGATVRVIVPHTPGLPFEMNDGGLEVRRFRYAPDGLERIGFQGDVRRSMFSPAALLAAPGYLWQFRAAVRRAIDEFQPDIVHAHWWLPGGWAATRQSRVPVVITCHGSDVRLLGKSALLRRLARGVFGRARAITTVSSIMRGDIRELMPGLEATVRLDVCPLPIEVALFERGAALPKADPPRILFAGNLIAAKGVDVLLRAFAKVVARGIPCRLKLLGEGAAKPELARLAESLGVGALIDWSTFVPMDRMPEEYGAATIVALPSRGHRGEGMPLSLAEALIGGAAVVATPAGGVPEIIHDGETGLLVPDGDDAALAGAIGSLLLDPALRTRLVRAGRASSLDRFAPGPAAAAFLSLFEEVRRVG